MIRALAIFVVSLLITINISAQTIYISALSGNDNNSGTKFHPLKTLAEAANRFNSNKEIASFNIILKEGVYFINQTAIFDNNKFSEGQRLTIRAEVLPDDKNWNIQKMPTIVTCVPLTIDNDGENAKGIQIELSHVSILGMKFTGSIDMMYKDENHIRRSYPIWRDGRDLDDLMISQCMFIGDPIVLPLHLGIIANGNGLVVDHCVFYNCKNSVVFWKGLNGNSTKNAMRYCLVYGNTFSGVWTAETDGNDFEFHNNIIANSKTAWIRENKSSRQYNVSNSIFSNNENDTGYGVGANAVLVPTNGDFLKTTNILKDGKIILEMNPSKRNYLQLADGSFGSDLGAGLFKTVKSGQ